METAGATVSVGWAVIADLVSSRSGGMDERDRLDRAILQAIDQLDDTGLIPVPSFAPTVGDELQAIFPTLRDAVRACVLLRLLLAEATDVRFGIGYGEIHAYDVAAAPFRQDGPAWWAARAALEEVEADSRARGGEAQLRTGLDPSASLAGVDHRAVNALLGLIDVTVAAMADKHALVAVGEIRDLPQADIAALAGMQQSNVSRSIRRHGARALRSALDSIPLGPVP
jgi:hypothetical protein